MIDTLHLFKNWIIPRNYKTLVKGQMLLEISVLLHSILNIL